MALRPNGLCDRPEWSGAIRLAVRLTADLERYRGQPVAEASVARFQADVQSAFSHLGWGVLSLDFSRFSAGLLVAEVRHAPPGGPADALLAGALAGLVSHVAGRDLALRRRRPPGTSGDL